MNVCDFCGDDDCHPTDGEGHICVKCALREIKNGTFTIEEIKQAIPMIESYLKDDS